MAVKKTAKGQLFLLSAQLKIHLKTEKYTQSISRDTIYILK